MLKKLCLYLCLYINFFLLTANAFAAGSGDTGLQKNLIEPAPAGTVDYDLGCDACRKAGHQHALLVSKENNQKIALAIISEEEAGKVFAEIVARGDIPFEYLRDGCYARAQKMALILDDKGILSGKVFMEGKIYYDTPNQGELGWSYQVSPVVLVKKNGQVIPYVIEPSFFTKPVPVAEWEAKLIQKAKTQITAAYYTNRFSYDTRDRNAKYDDFREDQLDDMDMTNRNHMRKLYVEAEMKRRAAAGR